MSAKATFWAWEQEVPSVQYRCVLLCLADCHNADTGQCNPSIAYISKKTKCDRKTIMKTISAMAESNLISIIKNAGSSNSYRLNLDSTNSVKQTHIVYRVTDPETAEYYIGLHSTYNINDGYIGSGRWVLLHKNKERLLKDILFTSDTRAEAAEKEMELIRAHIGDNLCRNIGMTPQYDHTKTSTTSGTTTNGTTVRGTSHQRDYTSTNEGTTPVPPVGHEPKKNLKRTYKNISMEILGNEISEETAKEFIDHRIKLKKPLTQGAFDRTMKKAIQASSDETLNQTAEEIIHHVVDSGWQSFQVSWLKNKQTAEQPAGGYKPVPFPTVND